MKWKSFFIILLLPGSMFVSAQNKYLGFKAGISIPDLSGGTNEVSKGYTSRLAANFGAVYEMGVSKKFSFQVEVNYAGQGGKRTGMQPITDLPQGYPANPFGDYYYADFKNVAILNYIEVPVLAKMYLGKKQKVYVDLGPNAGFLVSAKTKTSGSSYIYLDKAGTMPASPSAQSFDATTDVKQDINTVNFGFAGGGGVNFPMGKNMIFADARFAYGITNVQKDSEKNGKSHAGNIVISAGYAFRLGK
ncbi:MAG: PorT family protein [Bacteroidetes bacterium]|nr:PorT family protein [Bacteroidota bacterium]